MVKLCHTNVNTRFYMFYLDAYAHARWSATVNDNNAHPVGSNSNPIGASRLTGSTQSMQYQWPRAGRLLIQVVAKLNQILLLFFDDNWTVNFRNCIVIRLNKYLVAFWCFWCRDCFLGNRLLVCWSIAVRYTFSVCFSVGLFCLLLLLLVCLLGFVVWWLRFVAFLYWLGLFIFLSSSMGCHLTKPCNATHRNI